MFKTIKKEYCSGCSACFSSCPVNSIQMKPDQEGFLYPVVDNSICIQCGLCEKICPVVTEYHRNSVGQAYACINKNTKIRMQSSSGGLFTAIAEVVIDSGGVVFGASFDSHWQVYHRSVLSKEELSQVTGSKYIQSRIGNSYKQVKKYLEEDKLVLFSGTPCQISGIKAYLQKEYENLLLIDIICHGIPSPKVWDYYIRYRSKTAKKEFDFSKRPNFRSKELGWKRYSLVLPFRDGTCYQKTLHQDSYMKAFLANLSLRPSCYQCRSKSLERESDITLADFWGIEKLLPEFSDDTGISLIFVNSEKGRMIFEKIKIKIVWQQVDIYKASKYNTAAYQSVKTHPKRDDYLKVLSDNNFDNIVKKYTKISLLKKIYNKVQYTIKRKINFS